MRNIKIDFPNAMDGLVLQLAVKAMNDTLGPEGFVPSYSVFGQFPQVIEISEVPTIRATAASRA